MVSSARFPGMLEPMHIFQESNMFVPHAPMTSHVPMPAVTKPPRRPLANASTNTVLKPPTTAKTSYSPHKTASSSPRSPLKASGAGKLSIVPMAPPPVHGPTTDSLRKKPHLAKIKNANQRAGFDALASPSMDQENLQSPAFTASPLITSPLPWETQQQRPYLQQHQQQLPPPPPPPSKASMAKRTSTQPAPAPKEHDKPVFDFMMPTFPCDPLPPIHDDGTKPPHSYAQLIGMAILRSPNRRLTLAQIYKSISDCYSFYNPNDAGWQNSIRHNLSLHKNFIKIERPKDDPGKGNYWAIEPGTELQFLREKSSRKAAPSAENLPVMSTRLEPSPMGLTPTLPHPPDTGAPLLPALQHAPNAAPLLLPPPPPHSLASAPLQTPALLPADISSDATIPVDDAVTPEHAIEDPNENDPRGDAFPSPLPPNMRSSPPTAADHRVRQSRTPPSHARLPASSTSRSRKRKLAPIDDSGYISLDSSAIRPNQKALLLASDADRPRIKRGRAEEEIARLRASSPFSPTKPRVKQPSLGPVSSPVRLRGENQMLPPLTPVVKMKPPVRPPPSVSPSTNLRIHRDKVRSMLQSPLRRVTSLADEVIPWSPAFNLDHTQYGYDDPNATPGEFDIFHDGSILHGHRSLFNDFASADADSPTKRPVKRPRLDRPASASALLDITGANLNPAPGADSADASLRLPPAGDLLPARLLETPSKVLEGLSSPGKLFTASPYRNSPLCQLSMPQMPQMEAWADDHPLGDATGLHPDSLASFPTWDMLQGFERIGSGAPSARPAKATTKPSMERSFSSRF